MRNLHPVAAQPAAGSPVRAGWVMLMLGALLGCAAVRPAHAQFQGAPTPAAMTDPPSAAADAHAYRRDGAHHLYAAYPQLIHHGKLPPLMYAIAIIETEIDEEGRVVKANIVRAPAAAKEVGPWALDMIRHASPFPRPARLGHVRYTDIWLVNRDGSFQLDTLTEGQE